MGLYLNQERASYRRANDILLAFEAATGGLSCEWFEALNDDDERAQAEFATYLAHRELNARRAETF
ncbi:MAG: hypothetical protein AB7U73_01325 [Pirellulales bacterium]